jgi:hypothetical protein
MLRDLLDRFAYRYRLWSAENRGRDLGAGQLPPKISPESESAWSLIFRFLQMLAVGLIVLAFVGRVAAHALPSLSQKIGWTIIFLAVVWCGVGIFLMGGELLTKFNKSDDEDKRI